MESQVFELPKIRTDEPKLLRDLYKAILHTIFYHRTLGPLNELNYATCQVLKTTYAVCGDQGATSDIDSRFKELVKKVKENQGKGQFSIVVEFIEKKKERVLMIEREVEKSLEKWVIPFEFTNINIDDESKDVRPDIALRAEKILSESLIKVMELANQNVDNFPNIAPSSNSHGYNQTMPYKYKFTIEDMNKGGYGAGLMGYFRK